MRKTRPCVIVSPDEMNRRVRTVIIVPLTTTTKRFPYRVDCVFAGQPGQLAVDHVRSVDRVRLIRRLGGLDAATATRLSKALVAMLTEGEH